MGSLRKEDNRLMSIVNDYLDTYFYPNIKKIKKFVRIDDKSHQLKGIDILLLTNEGNFVCDEKSAVKYRHLKTFAFELDSLNNVGGTGWLLNDSLDTDSYMLCWIDNSNKDVFDEYGKIIKKDIKQRDDITDITIAFVKKKSILDYIEDEGFDKNALKNKVNEIRKTHNTDEICGKLKFKLSNQLEEQPINVILNRNDIINISVWSYRMKDFKLISIK